MKDGILKLLAVSPPNSKLTSVVPDDDNIEDPGSDLVPQPMQLGLEVVDSIGPEMFCNTLFFWEGG